MPQAWEKGTGDEGHRATASPTRIRLDPPTASHDDRRAHSHRGAAMSGARAPFRQRLHEALASETLPVALDRSLRVFRERRAAAFRQADWNTDRKSTRLN